MRFRIDLKIFILLILFYFTSQVQMYAMIMIFALIHEIGHLLSGILLGMKAEKLEILPYGIGVSFKILPKDYNKKIIKGNYLEIKKILVALAGPITNLILIILISKLNINLYLKRFRKISIDNAERKKEAFKDHLEILEAIKRKDLPFAINLNRVHLEKSMNFILSKYSI